MGTPEPNEELRDAPILRSMRGRDPFEVPEGFFDAFPQRVQQRIAQRPGLLERLRNGLASIAPVRKAAIAAMTATLLIGGAMVLQRAGQEGVVNSGMTATIRPDEMDLELLDEQELYAEVYDQDLLASVPTGLEVTDLEAYLQSQDLSLELLSEEL